MFPVLFAIRACPAGWPTGKRWSRTASRRSPGLARVYVGAARRDFVHMDDAPLRRCSWAPESEGERGCGRRRTFMGPGLPRFPGPPATRPRGRLARFARFQPNRLRRADPPRVRRRARQSHRGAGARRDAVRSPRPGHRSSAGGGPPHDAARRHLRGRQGLRGGWYPPRLDASGHGPRSGQPGGDRVLPGARHLRRLRRVPDDVPARRRVRAPPRTDGGGARAWSRPQAADDAAACAFRP